MYDGKKVKKMREKFLEFSVNAKETIRFAVLCLLSVILWCMFFIPNVVDHSEEPIHHYMKGIGGGKRRRWDSGNCLFSGICF